MDWWWIETTLASWQTPCIVSCTSLVLPSGLVKNALERARTEFAPEVAAARFLSVLEGAS